MADYHIRAIARDKKTVVVIFHIPVPAAGTNQADISWQEAVVLEQNGASNITSVLPELIDQPEETSMKAGELIEKQETFRFSSRQLTDAQRKTEIEARFTALETELINEKQATLTFMGLTGDVI